MKILGSVLICISTTMIGLRIGNAERIRYHTLCGLSFALDFMIAEISCLLTPVKDILEKMEIQAPAPINQFFRQCALCCETESDRSVSQIWQTTARNAGFLCLKENELQILEEIGATFGRYTAEDQVNLLKGLQMQVDAMKETAKEEQSRNSQIYRSLGITCGIALAILLL